jgi:hypothetical protein
VNDLVIVAIVAAVVGAAGIAIGLVLAPRIGRLIEETDRDDDGPKGNE